MNASLGHWLFSTLGARETRALRQPDFQPVKGAFNPDTGSVPDLAVNQAAFEARYSLPFKNLKGSEIGEGRVPDRTELQACVRGSDNPCQLVNNSAYVVTEVDVLDLRFVARNGRPVWEFIEAQGMLCLRGGDGNGNLEQQLQAARAEIASLKSELGQKNARIGQLETEVNRLRALVPVAVPPDVDKTVALLTGAGNRLDIGPGIKARFKRLEKFVAALKARKA
jgi:hypothetical protein